MKQLQDEKDSLASQVDNLEREIVNLTAQLSVERGMISNASIDAAQLRVQLTGMRNELANCKHEAAQVIAAIRGVTGTGYGTGMGGMSMGYGAAAAGNNSAAAAAAAAMMQMGSAAGGYGASGGYGMMDGMDPAAAAATAAPPAATAAAAGGGFTANKKTAFTQKLGPGQTSVAAAPTSGPASAPAVKSSGEGGRMSNIGQLMQVGPGTLVVGPRSRRGFLPDQPTASTAAKQSAAVLAGPQQAQDAVPRSAADVPGSIQQEQQLPAQEQATQPQQQDAQTPDAAAAGTSKQVGGQSSDMNNGHAATAVAVGDGATAQPASQPNILEHDAAAVGLTTSEAALAADEDDSVSELAAVDQPAQFAADAVGRRPGRPSRKPGSGNAVPADAAVRPDVKGFIAGVEAMVGKKRIRSGDSPSAGHGGVDSGAADVAVAVVEAGGQQQMQNQALKVEHTGSVSDAAGAGAEAALRSSEQPIAASAEGSPPPDSEPFGATELLSLQHAEGADGQVHAAAALSGLATGSAQLGQQQDVVALAATHEPEDSRLHQVDAAGAADLQHPSRKRQKVVG